MWWWLLEKNCGQNFGFSKVYPFLVATISGTRRCIYAQHASAQSLSALYHNKIILAKYILACSRVFNRSSFLENKPINRSTTPYHFPTWYRNWTFDLVWIRSMFRRHKHWLTDNSILFNTILLLCNNAGQAYDLLFMWLNELRKLIPAACVITNQHLESHWNSIVYSV
jgi:hypothetical protein